MKIFQNNECGENRVALSDGKTVLAVSVVQDLVLSADEIISAQITDYHKGLKGYFAQTEKGSVFLPTSIPLTQGQTVYVQITKEARQDKDATGILTDETPHPTPNMAELWAERYQTDIIPVSAEDMDEMIADAMAADITLPGGEILHIERTKVCWTIDVDSAKSHDDLITVNQRVIPEIIRQISLKNMGGLILVDFAGSKRGKIKHIVERELKTLVSDDLTVLGGWTAMGLYEIQRKRERASLWDKCATDNPISVYYRILRALKKCRQGNGIIEASPIILPLLHKKNLKCVPIFDKTVSYFEIKEK